MRSFSTNAQYRCSFWWRQTRMLCLTQQERTAKQAVNGQKTRTERVCTYKDLVSDWWSFYLFAESLDFTCSRYLLTEGW